MSPSIDILGLGCSAVDDLLYVDAYPQPDEKMRVQRAERHCGGLTATALVAAARLGARCAFAGVLGHDDLSDFVAETLRREKIDLSHAVYLPDARPVHSTIIVGAAQNTRNIFFEIGGLTGAAEDRPDENVIRSARVVFLDHTGMKGAVRAARIAREAGVPVVADLERNDNEGFDVLLGLVDHLIISEKFACRLTGASEAKEAVHALWKPDRQVVVATAGTRGCWYRTTNTKDAAHFPAFAVNVVDSTGCGDVFHGAYAAGLAQGLTLEERIRLACAAAALKATKPGGQLGIPDKKSVEEFLKRDQPCHTI